MGACASKKVQPGYQKNLMRTRKTSMALEKYYETSGSLGEGSMGSVSVCTQRASGRKFALKTIQLDRISQDMINELKNEIDLLTGLDHPNIIRPLELFERKRQIYFIMELCSGGDLYTRAPYTTAQACRMVNTMLGALQYMHTRGIVHRDLKYENVLYETEEPEAGLRIIDFGLSKKYRRGTHMHDPVGTLYSMAPEVLAGTYTESCDMWSVGVLAFMLLSNTMPFAGSTDASLIRRIEAGDWSFKATTWLAQPAAAKDFVKSLIVRNPTKRLTSLQALRHPWLATEHEQQTDKARRELHTGKLGDMVTTSLRNFGSFSKLKKAALMVVAHRSSTSEITQLRDAFMAIDTGRQGFITFDEFKSVLLQVHPDMAEDSIAEAFSGVDIDESGKVSYTEFIAASLETMGQLNKEQLAEAFDRLDSDDSGAISVTNLKEVLGAHYDTKTVESIIADADIKKTGNIDFEEFLAMFGNKENPIAPEMKQRMTIRQSMPRRADSDAHLAPGGGFDAEAVAALAEGESDGEGGGGGGEGGEGGVAGELAAT